MDLPEAFYLPDGADRFVPSVATESPWDRSAQHGGPPLALAAHYIETRSGAPGRRGDRVALRRGLVPRPGDRGGVDPAAGAVDRGVPLAPSSRALVVADAANGVSGGLPLREFWFIPPGVSVAMVREPNDEWVRLTAVTRRSDDGLGVTSGQLSDRAGYCGEVVQPLMIAPR